MPRIPLFPLETMSAEQRRVYEAASSGVHGPVRGPTTAVLHNPELAETWRALGDVLRSKTSFRLRLSELAILVTARRWTAQFVWHTHEPVALKGGLAPAVIDAIRENRRPDFAPADELAVYDYSIELAERGTVSEPAYRRALDLFGAIGVVELTAIVGYYSMVAMTVNAHEIGVPDGTLPLERKSS